MKLNDESIHKYGKKHRGKKLEELPDDYMIWLFEEINSKKEQRRSRYETAFLKYFEENEDSIL